MTESEVAKWVLSPVDHPDPAMRGMCTEATRANLRLVVQYLQENYLGTFTELLRNYPFSAVDGNSMTEKDHQIAAQFVEEHVKYCPQLKLTLARQLLQQAALVAGKGGAAAAAAGAAGQTKSKQSEDAGCSVSTIIFLGCFPARLSMSSCSHSPGEGSRSPCSG
jgi:hypothetical protein